MRDRDLGDLVDMVALMESGCIVVWDDLREGEVILGFGKGGVCWGLLG